MHITDLDFYRSPKVMNWSKTLIGDMKFSRRYDDQIGVTVPAAVWAGNRTSDITIALNNYSLDIFHNGKLDGKDSKKVGGGKYTCICSFAYLFVFAYFAFRPTDLIFTSLQLSRKFLWVPCWSGAGFNVNWWPKYGVTQFPEAVANNCTINNYG